MFEIRYFRANRGLGRRGINMARNYQKENEWKREKYTRLTAFLDKEYAEDFREKLKKENKLFTAWLREQIDNYMKN